jgi:alpha-N-acetylglucosaminidase
VTFSYTSAFWSWEDWELELDWLALRGVNLPLAWVGAEKIMVEVFREIGLTDAEIATFLSGPAFQAWNRFGNSQGSWGGDLPMQWIDDQFALQKQIMQRMVELGMTPVLPAFTGFVPNNITRVMPNASVVRGSQWAEFPIRYTNDSFLEPFDSHYAQLQKSFIHKQQAAYGNVTHIYTLDQYNENAPYSGDLTYLSNVTHGTWQSMKAADPQAIWMMQGWLFYSDSTFWTDQRVEAYLSGVQNNEDMLIIDLYSESVPEWQRTNSYYGKPWIWCQLHDFGGNMGLYGQIENITVDATNARLQSPSMVGYGLSMEGQENGNEIVYDLMLDQAWSQTAIDTDQYFHDWVSSRYSGAASIPSELYKAWDIMRTTVYNNTDLASAIAVTKSIFELKPNTEGLTGLTGHHPTTLNYDPAVLVHAWQLMHQAANRESTLWTNPSYEYDMVDVTRQVMANAFIPLYSELVSTYENNSSSSAITAAGDKLVHLLQDLDKVLLTNPSFRLSGWIDAARSWANGDAAYSAYLEYNARNQITLWGPQGQISDYASKSWAGLVSTYYAPRWEMFTQYLNSTPVAEYNFTAFDAQLLDFGLKWCQQTWSAPAPSREQTDLKKVLAYVQGQWPTVFGA